MVKLTTFLKKICQINLLRIKIKKLKIKIPLTQIKLPSKILRIIKKKLIPYYQNRLIINLKD